MLDRIDPINAYIYIEYIHDIYRRINEPEGQNIDVPAKKYSHALENMKI